MHVLAIALLALALIFLLPRLLGPSLEQELKLLVEQGNDGPLREAIAKLRPGAQPSAYNRVIRRVWDAYQRELAMPLIRAFVQAHPEEPVAQYWLQQARTVEPELAAASFDSEFLAQVHRPDVAASCGPVG